MLAAGHCDAVVEADLKPYDYMALVPIVTGAGGKFTDWNGDELRWQGSVDAIAEGEFQGEVCVAGDEKTHAEAPPPALRGDDGRHAPRRDEGLKNTFTKVDYR